AYSAVCNGEVYPTRSIELSVNETTDRRSRMIERVRQQLEQAELDGKLGIIACTTAALCKSLSGPIHELGIVCMKLPSLDRVFGVPQLPTGYEQLERKTLEEAYSFGTRWRRDLGRFPALEVPRCERTRNGSNCERIHRCTLRCAEQHVVMSCEGVAAIDDPCGVLYRATRGQRREMRGLGGHD